MSSLIKERSYNWRTHTDTPRRDGSPLTPCSLQPPRRKRHHQCWWHPCVSRRGPPQSRNDSAFVRMIQCLKVFVQWTMTRIIECRLGEWFARNVEQKHNRMKVDLHHFGNLEECSKATIEHSTANGWRGGFRYLMTWLLIGGINSLLYGQEALSGSYNIQPRPQWTIIAISS
jgi:hypothetical protein